MTAGAGERAPGVAVRPMRRDDWAAVRAIYAEGIATGDATFETEPPDWARFDREHLAHSRLVARGPAGVLGWALLSPVSSRPCYAGVAEVSLYVGAGARGRGVGSALLSALVAESEQAGLWTLEAWIFPENTASLALHARAGFREVGRRERLGRDANGWRDVLLLERRSPPAEH